MNNEAHPVYNLDCPLCHQPLNVATTWSGVKADCPLCGIKFDVWTLGSKVPAQNAQAVHAREQLRKHISTLSKD